MGRKKKNKRKNKGNENDILKHSPSEKSETTHFEDFTDSKNSFRRNEGNEAQKLESASCCAPCGNNNDSDSNSGRVASLDIACGGTCVEEFGYGTSNTHIFTLESGNEEESQCQTDETDNCSSDDYSQEYSSVISSRSSATSLLVQEIHGKNIMIGQNNTLNDTSETTKSSKGIDTLDFKRSFSESSVKERRVRSYSQACSSQIITAESVTINVGSTESGNETPLECNKRLFVDSIQQFSRGHYLLITHRLSETGIPNSDALFLVPWIAVLDLDPKSRHSGLLSRAEKTITKVRSLHIVNWQEKCSFNENSTFWIGMNGCSDRPETRTEGDFLKWKKQIKSSFDTQIKQLNKFGESFTDFTVLAFWPSTLNEAQQMQYILDVLAEILNPKLILISEGIGTNSDVNTILACTLLNHKEYIVHVVIPLSAACKIIANYVKPVTTSGSGCYQLPISDTTCNTDITDEDAQWLKEDLEVLYINDKTGKIYDQETIEKEEDNFFKGSNLSWNWWYQMGPGCVDTERDITKELIANIQTHYIDQCRSGCVTLLHNPGSGGTTLSQRIVWCLREKIPCAQVKHRHGLSVVELAERVKFISDKTRLPVLLLVVGEDESMVDAIQRCLRDICTVVVFYVKRIRQRIREDVVERKLCKLKSNISIREARHLGLTYKHLCDTQVKKEKIDCLVKAVENEEEHTIFEFGLAVHSFEYRGIETYVREFLALKDNLYPWQKALAYLSLVYYYGQASVPCKFLAGFLGSENAEHIQAFEDFPEEMKEFMVKDVQERKSHMVRITHFYVAKEILDQVLTLRKEVNRKPSPQICPESKKKLADFAIGFLKEAGQMLPDGQSQTIIHIMTRTFILRDNKTTGESETQTSQSRRPRFSLILEDVSNRQPFTERFEILQQLTRSFPHAAQFRAHLGRLYTICRPEETTKAEECFKEALNIIEEEFGSCDDLPHSIKLDLMHIYHMYGNMVLLQISQYTGKFLGDKPKKNTPDELFEDRAKKILPLVTKACSLFRRCRDVTPIGCEESFGFIGEIQVRLMFCSFVDSKSKIGIHQYSHERQTDAARFVKSCYTDIDELFLLCFSGTEPDKMDDSIFNCQKWYEALFKKIPGNIVHKKADTVTSCRLHIAKIKMKYCSADKYGILEQIDDVGDVCTVVRELEKNFNDYQNKPIDKNISIRSVDLDYREWIVAIRHPLFEENYSLEDVLKYVNKWHDQVNSPHSRFYLFVMKSLLGLGSNLCPGYKPLLSEAQSLKDDVIKHSKYVTKPRYPREWLGIQENGISRLVPGRRFFGNVECRDNHGIDFSALEVQKGTICPPNNKPAVGFIDLDLGPDNRVAVRVFFIPARTAENLKGTAYNNRRVEFVIGFSLQHGYEAFNVALLGHVSCFKCKQPVEKRTSDFTVECPRCHVHIKCKRNATSRPGAPRGNGSSHYATHSSFS